MPHIPDSSHPVMPYPFALRSLPGCRSISDDDLCAWCTHLLYRPGELSLCRLSLADGHWPHAAMRTAMRSPARHSG
ncbi:hypothetical protein QW41_02545 [Salmonella enterica]|uniref:Antirestriction protein n=1 Tax=Salmonella enterica TaxID=28901 RepID=A0A3V4NJA2_SALER|nr:hypothetical protein [Salmonella enterica]EBP3673418.1 hypothetical protein [Salmonella enterica subsp. enterica]EBW8695779.1 hypothetical protein [Salmonella enterica subsp. diarizonae serovar 16:z10:e,n,x,z15]EDW0433086.1 hypothetical protein [Salmonella enterica subsp. enterica serovar Lexington]EEJ6652663.1 hypothetical protein [Salmonella enterica subsp. enterica serovar Redlands]